MKVFISWSKPASKALGLVLRDWLPEVIQQIEPWMSSEDIDKGQRWAAEIGAKLGDLGQGILCVTAENQGQPWLNFEAGALAKSLDEARVRPLLLDLDPADVTGPLAQFQATRATEREDMLRLVASLNAALAAPLPTPRLERAFDRLWDDYLTRVEAIKATPSAVAPAAGSRSVDEMMREVLDRVRDLQRSFDHAPRSRKEPIEMSTVQLAGGGKCEVGSRVLHPEFGRGVVDILRFYPSEKDFKAGVRFDVGRGRIVSVADLVLFTEEDSVVEAED